MLPAVVLCALAVAQSEPVVDRAQDESPPPRPGHFLLRADLAARANPLGAMALVSGVYRRELGQAASPGWPAPYLEGGLSLGVNPAYGQASLHVEWMQLAFLVLRAQGDLFAYFGANGTLLRLPNRDALFGDGELKALAGQEVKHLGGRLFLQPTLRAKIGPIIFRNQTDLAWYHFGGGGPFFYEPEYDTLLKDGDVVVANRTAVLLELWSRGSDATFMAGPFYNIQRAWAAHLQRQTVGGAAFFCPTERLGWLVRPRLYVQAGVYLADRNRDGQLFVAGGVGADFELNNKEDSR